MARRYDSSTTTFSPDGRVHQVEYAIEAINQAGTCVGILCSDGIIMAAELRTTSKLLAPVKSSEKTYKIDDHCSSMVAGLTSDANVLINQVRLNSQRYLYRYNEPMPIEQIVRSVCDYKQSYTQFGGLRPFGVAFLFAGWDSHFGFQLYETSPAGNYFGWKATVIGANHQAGESLLKSDYEVDKTVDENMELAAKVLLKTMDSSTPTAEKMEFFVLRKNENGNITHQILSRAETSDLIAKVEAQNSSEGDL